MKSRLLDDAKCLVLSWPGRNLPILAPMAFWWDGQHVWMSTSADSLKARALRRDGSCVMYVPPQEGEEVGLLLRGTARVFHAGDPVGLAIHGGFLAAAQTALMVKNASSMMGYVADVGRVPVRFQPQQRVLIRVRVEEQTEVEQPTIGPGIAPAMPTEVPADVRRALAGQRRIVLGTQTAAGVGLLPAVLGAGYAVQFPSGVEVSEGTSVTAVLACDPGSHPTQGVGISLSGTIVTVGPTVKILPSKVRWWSGFTVDSADLSGRPEDPIVIPE